MGHFSGVRLGTSGGRQSLWPQKKENNPEANRINCVKEPRALGNTLLDRLSQRAPFQVLNTSCAHTHTQRLFIPSTHPSSSVTLLLLVVFTLRSALFHALPLCDTHSAALFSTLSFCHMLFLSLLHTHTHLCEPPQRRTASGAEAQAPLLSAVWLQRRSSC